MVDSHAFIYPGGGQLASVLASTESLVASTRQLNVLTKIFPGGISSPPTHVFVHLGSHTEEVCISPLDGHS
jgi:hypothetical protein